MSLNATPRETDRECLCHVLQEPRSATCLPITLATMLHPGLFPYCPLLLHLIMERSEIYTRESSGEQKGRVGKIEKMLTAHAPPKASKPEDGLIQAVEELEF